MWHTAKHAVTSLILLILKMVNKIIGVLSNIPPTLRNEVFHLFFMFAHYTDISNILGNNDLSLTKKTW